MGVHYIILAFFVEKIIDGKLLPWQGPVLTSRYGARQVLAVHIVMMAGESLELAWIKIRASSRRLLRDKGAAQLRRGKHFRIQNVLRLFPAHQVHDRLRGGEAHTLAGALRIRGLVWAQ